MNWTVAVSEISPSLFRYFHTSLSAEVADELVQETLIRLVAKVEAGHYDSQRGSLRAFAYGIGHHVRQEQLRKVRGDRKRFVDDAREAVAQTPSPTPSPHDLLERSTLSTKLRTAIARLTDAEQAVIALLLDRDLSLPEISSVMQMPLGSVKSHMHRAKKRLRDMMQHGEQI